MNNNNLDAAIDDLLTRSVRLETQTSIPTKSSYLPDSTLNRVLPTKAIDIAPTVLGTPKVSQRPAKVSEVPQILGPPKRNSLESSPKEIPKASQGPVKVTEIPKVSQGPVKVTETPKRNSLQSSESPKGTKMTDQQRKDLVIQESDLEMPKKISYASKEEVFTNLPKDKPDPEKNKQTEEEDGSSLLLSDDKMEEKKKAEKDAQPITIPEDLKAMFPNVKKEDMEKVLRSCKGNRQRAETILSCFK